MAIPPFPVGSPLIAQTPSTRSVKPAEGDFRIETDEPVNTREQFDQATREFGEALRRLPERHKKKIRTIHQSVQQFVAAERKAGRQADKLSTFVERVMDYSHQQLDEIEETDPDLVNFKAQHEELSRVFNEGAELVDAYHAYVKDPQAR